jgi:phosphopantothenoylcysteine decarboxylase/phosphopantothenate--cysteine ligase
MPQLHASNKIPTKKTILITAGPTIEPIDPIRYISNYSTGVMGYEIAKVARKRGYKVVLISGPTSLKAPKGVRLISVKTAFEMRRAVFKFFGLADCVIMAAAVSDFYPVSFSKKKIKKITKKNFSLKLKKTPDILLELGRKKGRRVLVGYSLETEKPIENAKKKLASKNLDFIVVNKIGKTSPFGTGPKDIAIIDRKRTEVFRGISKRGAARLLLDKIG